MGSCWRKRWWLDVTLVAWKARNRKSLHGRHLPVALKIWPHRAITASALKEPTGSAQPLMCSEKWEARAEVSLNSEATLETHELKDMSCTQSKPRRKMIVPTSAKQSMTPDQANITHCYHNYRHKEVDRRFYISMPVVVPSSHCPFLLHLLQNLQPLLSGNSGNRIQPWVSSVHWTLSYCFSRGQTDLSGMLHLSAPQHILHSLILWYLGLLVAFLLFYVAEM